MSIAEILMRSSDGEILNSSEARNLLAIEPDTIAFYWLLATAGQKPTGNVLRDRRLAVAKLSHVC